MTELGRKRLRDLKTQPGTSLAVAAVMALGVMLFVASAGAYRDLRDSYAMARQRLALAGLHVDLSAPAAAEVVQRVAALPEVETAEARAVAELPVTPGERGRRATLRLLSLPEEQPPALDKVLVLEGDWPRPGEVLLEKHFARQHQLGPGDTLKRPNGAPLAVSGVGVSAEYLWVSRSEHDFLTSAEEFGVGWARASMLEGLETERKSAQLLVQPRGAVPVAAAEAAVREVLGPAEVLAVTEASELVGVKLLQMDVDGYKGMAAFFPIFFLAVGAFIMASVLVRLVDAQRELIGTFLALGVARGIILRHYAGHALLLGGAGGVVGLVLGAAAAPAMTDAYAQELNIPFVEAHQHPDLLLGGMAMALLVSAVSGLLPALRAMRLTPAAAMRSAAPSVSRLAKSLRKVRAPLAVQLAVRDVADRPLRSIGTIFGVAAALVLVLSTGALMDSMRTTFDAIFTRAAQYDDRVDFAMPVPEEQVLTTARGLEGVERAEALLALPVRVSANGRHVDALFQGVGDAPQLVRAADADGSLVTLAPGGAALNRHAAGALAVQVGDEVTVTPVGQSEQVKLKITAFADAAMGNTLTARRADVDAVWKSSGLVTSLVVGAPGHSEPVRQQLAAAFPHALRVEDTAASRAQFDALMGLGWVMLTMMLGFGGVLAGAILFTTATLLVLERQRELATLRAMGLRMREVTALVTIQHAVLTVLGLAVGLPLAALAAKGMLLAFSSELFALPFVLTLPTVSVTLVGVVLVLWLAQWPALRQVRRASLAEAVRVRG